LMQNAEGFEQPAIRLAQKARACGIHLVLATQRPSADVIKGLLKTNIPGRIALSVSSKIDSKIILDITGAESLTGKGDLICLCPAFRDGIRLQGAYITNEEIQKIMATKAKD
jgi:S-DNA-T family DNA segregation ATPase FtsK/SpoIIIE